MLERLKHMPPRQRLLLAGVLGIAIAYFVIRGRQAPATTGDPTTDPTQGAQSIDQTPTYTAGDPYGLGYQGSFDEGITGSPTLSDILASVKQARDLLRGLGWTVKAPTKKGGHKNTGSSTTGGGGTTDGKGIAGPKGGYRAWLKAHPHASFKERWDELQLFLKKGWGDSAQLHQREQQMRLYAQRHPPQKDKGKGTATATAGESPATQAQARAALPTAASVRAVRSAQKQSAQPRSGTVRHPVQATVKRRPAARRAR